MNLHEVNGRELSLEKVYEIVKSGTKLVLAEPTRERIAVCRDYLDNKMETHNAPIYGINTGFGSLCNTSISNDDLEQLQENLVMSHACGLGDRVPQEIVKIMLFLKIQGLSYGYSGAQVATIERMIEFYNEDIIPIVFQQGSLGASGDLAPLAHLSLPIIGQGEVVYNGEERAAQDVLKEKGWSPIRLKSKEGLALLNGTQFMSSFGVWASNKANRILELADLIGALSLDAFDGRIEPFSDLPHLVRQQPGQLETARNFRDHLDGSDIVEQEKLHVQDPYSFRCIPQVHGASKDVVAFVKQTFTYEINSVTDNPTVFPEEDQIISAGNFHGQPLAMAFDQLCIAMAEIGSISERRVYKLISGQRDLPAFLVARPGLNSGFMIPQYTAASIVSQNKQFCMPASVDTIDSSNGQEDHVSMGANAATKCFKVIENVEKLLGIELLNAAQALEFRRPLESSPKLEKLHADLRKEVSFIDDDKVMYTEMKKAIEFVKNLEL